MAEQPAKEPPVGKGANRRIWLRAIWLVLLGTAVMGYVYASRQFPPDTTPQGAYLRIVKEVNLGKPAAFFAYTEEAAQHACFTIRDYRSQGLAAARGVYPADEFAKLEAEYGPYAQAVDGPAVFALLAEEQGWMIQLRRDVSGIARVEESGPRATVETAQGTRYAFRRRPNGIWGLTAFTPTLVAEAERAARDLEQVKKAAADFQRASALKTTQSPASDLK